ncbi:MAG: heavy-metal-associated domain-containing protein [Betaproteobacteria bacterium]|nr:heavy-metal-associated domain-containing protein [Betaproteobacteria bacterium]
MTWRQTVLIVSLLLMSTAAVAAPQVYKLGVDGLACPFCAYGVEKKLKAVKGVEKVDVDIKTGNVIVTVVEGAVFDQATAKKAVTEAGFTLRGFEKIPQGTSK